MAEYDYTVIGDDASFITREGEILTVKILASKGVLRFTRAQVGSGPMPEGMTPYQMTGCNGYVCDAKIEGVTNPFDGEVCLGVQLSSIGLPEGLDVTNIAVMAEDVETGGEACYCYFALHQKPQPIRPEGESVNTLARFLIFILVSGVQLVEAVINPDCLITRDQMEGYFEMIVRPACLADAQHYVDFIHNVDAEAHPWLKQSMQSLRSEVDKLMEMFNGSGSAPFYWDLGVPEGWEIEKGVINLAQNRVEC